MGDQLDIFTLGGLSIRCNGTPVTGFVSRKVEALLVYLACQGRPQPREVLAELLWEERSQAQSMGNLRVVLNDLRQHLEPFVVVTRQSIGLDLASACWLDVTELQSAISAAQAQWMRGVSLFPKTAKTLEKALDLYTGDFLAGFSIRDSQAFDHWLSTERERLRQEVVEALHHFVDYCLKNNAFAAGIAKATQSLQIDPLREETYQQLMLLLSMSGQRGAALAQYDTCCRVLAEELGIEPNAPTIALANQIRSGLPIASRPKAMIPTHNLPMQATPFIGRDVELSQIARSLADPNCRLLTLIGPGGIGKTRLALQAAAAQDERFPHGVYFVPLAAVGVPDELVYAIADAVKVALAPSNSQMPDVQLRDYLHDKELLLLDNFEHLLEGSILVGQLLTHALRLKIMITSRERLNLQEEWLFNMQSMDVPGDEMVDET